MPCDANFFWKSEDKIWENSLNQLKGYKNEVTQMMQKLWIYCYPIF